MDIMAKNKLNNIEDLIEDEISNDDVIVNEKETSLKEFHEREVESRKLSAELQAVMVKEVAPILEKPEQNAKIVGYINPGRHASNYPSKDVGDFKYIEVPAFNRVKGYVEKTHF